MLIPAVVGTLKGYDQLMNLVLDDVKESMRGMSLLFFSFYFLFRSAPFYACKYTLTDSLQMTRATQPPARWA